LRAEDASFFDRRAVLADDEDPTPLADARLPLSCVAMSNVHVCLFERVCGRIMRSSSNRENLTGESTWTPCGYSALAKTHAIPVTVPPRNTPPLPSPVLPAKIPMQPSPPAASDSTAAPFPLASASASDRDASAASSAPQAAASTNAQLSGNDADADAPTTLKLFARN
jgi:hypothetical protein